MQMRFLRLSKGLNHSTLIPITDSILDIVKKNPKQDYYTSLYTYSDHHAEHFRRTRSVASLKDVTTSRLLFDFDDASNIESARKDAVEVCNRLITSGVPNDKIRACFSGAKGFSLEVCTRDEMTRQQFVNVVFNLAGDLQTFDTRINDEARIIRVPFSQHPKSKLHKTPLTLEELTNLPIDQIKEFAKEPDFDNYGAVMDDSLYTIDMPEKLKLLREKQYKKVSQPVLERELTFDVKDIDWTQCPRWMEKARFALQQGFFWGSETAGQGERNAAFMILAATYRSQGFSLEHTLGLLMATAEKQAARTGEDPYTEDQMQREILGAVFSLSWQGGIYAKDEPLLVTTRERFGLDEEVSELPLVQIKDVGDRFKNFAANFYNNRIMTGIEELDKRLVLTTGMAVGLLGAPSSAKTSILNSIVEFQSKKNTPCIYQSLDMSDNLLYLRLLQKYSRLPIEQILEAFQDNKLDTNLTDAYVEVIKNYSNVHFNFRSAMTVDMIDRDIQTYIKETGRSPKFIAIDYLEKVRSDFSDPTTSTGLIASQLSDLAKKYDALVMVLLQPQKSAGDPSQPLLSMRKVKGASQIEQDLRCIITIWRPGFNPQDSSRDKFLSMAVVKNNLGELCQLDFKWNGLAGSLASMDFDDKAELKELREQLAINAAMRSSDGDF
jgi:replicative DNA helicase